MSLVRDLRLVAAPVGFARLEPFPAEAGAECVFLGRTRAARHREHGDLLRLEYEAYEPMALQVIEALADEAAVRFGCRALRLLHALGPVAVGEASVLVQVACGHRAEAFDACRMLIDRLKAEVPIWKREVWRGGATWPAGTMPIPPLRAASPDAPALS